MRAYFVSDLHLKTPDEPNAQVFESFLRGLCRSVRAHDPSAPTHLFLVGDVFDLWIGDHEYFTHKFGTIIADVRELVSAGVEVHFFEGNHDLHLQPYWQDQLGARVHADAEYFQLGHSTVRVEHGDMINPDDKGYLFLRKFLRSKPMRTLALSLPSPVVAAIGERASKASRKYTSTAKELPRGRIQRMIREHAERTYREKPFDLIVTGHVHVKDDVTFAASGRKVRSVNLGSWYEPAEVFVLTDAGAEFLKLS